MFVNYTQSQTDFIIHKVRKNQDIEKIAMIYDLDINIILEKPHLNKHILSMRKNLSKLLTIDSQNISIKATTSDQLGFIGTKQGIMSTATILLIKKL